MHRARGCTIWLSWCRQAVSDTPSIPIGVTYWEKPRGWSCITIIPTCAVAAHVVLVILICMWTISVSGPLLVKVSRWTSGDDLDEHLAWIDVRMKQKQKRYRRTILLLHIHDLNFLDRSSILLSSVFFLLCPPTHGGLSSANRAPAWPVWDYRGSPLTPWASPRTAQWIASE